MKDAHHAVIYIWQGSHAPIAAVTETHAPPKVLIWMPSDAFACASKRESFFSISWGEADFGPQFFFVLVSEGPGQ